MTKLMPLTKGRFATVDDCDFDRLNQWKWSYIGGYARRTAKINGIEKSVRMHRFILRASSGARVDHIDGDPLNNTRANLRYATSIENGRNARKKHNSTSRYKGVTWIPSAKKRKWRALITIDKKLTHIGYFTSEVDAGRAYDRAAIKHFGDFARLNFDPT